MPIRRSQRHLYGKAWKTIALSIKRDRAGWRCECAGECGHTHGGRCVELHRQPATWVHNKAAPELFSVPQRRPKRVILTVAHLDRRPYNNDATNLRAMCQRCHLAYDREEHAAQRSATWAARRLLARVWLTQLVLRVQPAPTVQLALVGAPTEIPAEPVELVRGTLASRASDPAVSELYAIERRQQLRLFDQPWTPTRNV